MGGAEKCHGITKSHGEVEFDEANEIAATSAAIAVEKILGRVHQEAGLVIGVQRTQSHQSPAGDAADGFPILRLQVVQQGNLLFECVDGRPRHGEFASNCRLRSTAAQSQARMVGARQKVCQPGQQNQKAFTLQH
jgi:hypothetical protein